MDLTRRKLTKIAREVSKFTVRTMRAEGIGSGEFDVIHAIRKNPDDGRSQLLYATKKVENLKHSKVHIETLFYEWLLAELSDEEKDAFCTTLDKLYQRSKKESKADFIHVSEIVANEAMVHSDPPSESVNHDGK